MALGPALLCHMPTTGGREATDSSLLLAWESSWDPDRSFRYPPSPGCSSLFSQPGLLPTTALPGTRAISGRTSFLPPGFGYEPSGLQLRCDPGALRGGPATI